MDNSTKTVSSINFSVSGWSGSGATSLALLLTSLFEYNYLHMGGVFRHLGMVLGSSEEGLNRPQFDSYVEPIIGHTVDKYRDHKLLEGEKTLVDSDLGTFLIGKHPKVFSVFLKSSHEARIGRVIKDKRDDAVSVLKERDETNKNFYMDLHDVDIYDEELIDRKFNCVIDNTNVTLKTEVELVIESLSTIEHIKDQFNFEKILSKVDYEISDFSVTDKNIYKEKLKKLGLIISPQDIIKDMTKTFPEDITEYPENIRNIFLGINEN